MRLPFRLSASAVLAVLLMLSAVLTLLGASAGSRIRGMFHWALVPLGDAGTYLSTRFSKLTAPRADVSPHEATELAEDNEALLERNAALEAYLLRQEQMLRGGEEIYSRVFSAQFGPQTNVPVRLIGASVVAADALPYGLTRLVNAGNRQDVRDGLFVVKGAHRLVVTDRSKRLPENLDVLCGSGLVGRVEESMEYSARVRLVSDAGFKIDAQIQRVVDPDRPRLIRRGASEEVLTPQNNSVVGDIYACGDGRGGMVATEVPAYHNILPGDLVLTSGSRSSLPMSVNIGRVTKVAPGAAGFVTLSIQPDADLPSLREVYIVVPLWEAGRGKGDK